MSYRVEEKDGSFEIIEQDTNLVVVTRTDRIAASILAKSLNRGYGFNGFTPMFFTLRYPNHAEKNAVQN